MFERLLLLASLGTGLAMPLQGQAPDLSTLERRFARLRDRMAQVTAEVARRDSLAFAAQRPRAIGAGPIILVVPDWAAPILEPDVVRINQEAARQYGEAYIRSPAETLAVPYSPLDPEGTGRAPQGVERDTSDSRATYLAARRFDVGLMALDRIGRRMGPVFLAAIGGRYRGDTFADSRRRAVITLSTDTSGAGRRCLKGMPEGCVQALAVIPGGPGAALRRSLLAWVGEHTGPEGWTRLVESDPPGFEARLSMMAGRPYHELVTEWGVAVRTGRDRRALDYGEAALVLGWGVLFATLFGWRLKWHRV